MARSKLARKPIVALALFGLVTISSLASADHAPGTARKAVMPRRPACLASETPIFVCSLGRKSASICTAAGRYIYRYGSGTKAEIEIASNGHDGRAFVSGGVGGGGGSFTNIRFSAGAFSYVASSGEAGQLTDVPGKQWSVVTVLKDGDVVTQHQCTKVNPQLRMMEAKLPRDPDDRFVAWF